MLKRIFTALLILVGVCVLVAALGTSAIYNIRQKAAIAAAESDDRASVYICGYATAVMDITGKTTMPASAMAFCLEQRANALRHGFPGKDGAP